MSELFGKCGAKEERQRADQKGTHCLNASLLEIAAVAGGELKNLEEVFPGGSVNQRDLLRAVELGSQALGLKIKQILADPLFIKYCDVTLELKDKIEIVTGERSVGIPNIRIMCKWLGLKTFRSHAECEDGSGEAKSRITELERNGWLTVMVVEFGSKE